MFKIRLNDLEISSIKNERSLDLNVHKTFETYEDN